MAVSKKISLVDFAAEKAPPPCRVCVLPERPEIDDAYRSGIPRRIIHEWLIDVKDYKPSGPDGITPTAIDKHLTLKHHLKDLAS